MILHDWLAEWSGWGWPLFANHLWQATLFSALVFVAAWLLRRGPSRPRQTLWIIAAAKFAVPSSLLALLITATGFNISSTPNPREEGAGALETVSQLTSPAYRWVETDAVAAVPGAHNELYCVLTLAWLSGAAFFIGFWSRRRLRFSRAMRTSAPITSGREIEALGRSLRLAGVTREVRLIVSRGANEPGVWRVLRPAIVLPEGMADNLTDAELEAVLMHELIHVARWDNLVSNLHMGLCCLLWFHPLVWLIDREMLNERERACDEAVVGFGSGSEIYASSLLKVLRFCLGWKVAGVSYAAGSNLRRRVDRIMANDGDLTLRLKHRVLVGTIAALVVVFSIAAGLATRGPVVAQENTFQAGRVTGGVPGGVAGGVPGGVAGAVPGGVAGGVPGSDDGGFPSGLPGEVTQASRDVHEELRQAPDVTIQFKNGKGSPVSISEASLKWVKLGRVVTSRRNARGISHDDYIVRPHLKLVNNTDRRITALAVEFENAQGHSRVFFERTSAMIEPQGSFAINNRLISFESDPTSVVAEVVGVIFEDGETWGDVPPPPPPPPPAPRPGAVPEAPPEHSITDPRVPPGAPPPPLIRKSGGVLQGTAIKRVQPSYPLTAKENQVSGSVVVEVTIDEDGNVESARAVQGHPDLREAALDAARQWQFAPTELSGSRVKVIGTITFNFTL